MCRYCQSGGFGLQVTRTKECTVCYDDAFVDQFPTSPHAGSERHGRDVCFSCWEQHMRSELDGKEWNEVSCAQCDHILSEGDIKALDLNFTSRLYLRWLDKAAKSCLEGDEEFRECPSAACSYGYFHSTKEDGNIFRCQLCQSRYCVLCEVPMHEGMTCKQYSEGKRREKEAEEQQRANKKRKREIEDEEQRSAEEVKKVSKPCPGCGINLDKYTGCDHVTCRKCRFEFCWICFAPYKGPQGILRVGNSAHSDGCKHNPRALPNYHPPRR